MPKSSSTCRRCSGAAVLFTEGSLTFLWRHPFTQEMFDTIAAKHALHKGFPIVLFLFGAVAFAGALVFHVLPVALGGAAPETLLRLPTHWSFQVFLVSLLTDAWLFSRLSRDKRKKDRVLSREAEEHFQTGKRPYTVDITPVFTPEALTSLGQSLSVAARLHHHQLVPLHLFVALLQRSSIQHIASRLAVDTAKLKKAIHAAFGTVPADRTAQSLPTDDFYSLLIRAYRHAQAAQKYFVDDIDLFSATIDHETRAQAVLEELGITVQTIENIIAWFNQDRVARQKRAEIFRTAVLRPSGDINRAMTSRATPLVNRFSSDLTRAASVGNLRLPIGVDEQLRDLLTSISATSKNILLIGQEGTGKSALISGIAYAMVGEQVPDRLKDHRLVSISAGHLAATQNPLATFQALLDELLEAGNIVLVIHNIHDFTAQRGLTPYDLTEVLAETIERTGMLVIATTTPSAFHSYLESHPLISLFATTIVEESDENKTIQILESHIPSLEHRYKVYFTYDAIASVVRLATRYVHEKYNPAKSIDVAEQVALAFAPQGKKKYARITPAEVARAVEKITHTKVGEVESTERDVLLHLEDKIHERMINQETAVSAVANALRRARVDLREKKRPISVFLFLGPTGVGKTELAKTLAEVYFGSADTMVRLDMSEYQGVSAIERLIGMTGSSVRGGALTEPVRKNPFSLLLLDELEKADRDVLNLFLQIFEDGRITDNGGEVIDYTNTIIIATSNAGSQFIQDSVRAGSDAETIKKELLERELRNNFSPEFLNRFDGVIIFGPLSEEHITQIARLMIARVQRQMQEKGITFSLTDGALQELAREGYDPQFGARPMRRVIQQRVEDVLAKIFLQEKIDRKDTIILDAGGVFRIEKGKRFVEQ